MGSILGRNERKKTMQEVDYCVMILRTDIESTKKIFEDIKPSFEVARGAYATEMSLITKMPESYYKINITDEEPQTFCLAIDKKNNVLGFILLEADGRTMTLWTCHVYVRPEVRCQGIYKLMMKRVHKFAKDAGFRRVFSVVNQRNKPSQIAHKSVGFKRNWIGYEIKEEDIANDNYEKIVG